jgi:hypothetical protein
MVTVGKNETEKLCFNCAGVAHSHWHGSIGNVDVCLACAVEILPALAADAVVGAVGQACGEGPLKRWLKTIEANYWKAATAALARVAEERKHAG